MPSYKESLGRLGIHWRSSGFREGGGWERWLHQFEFVGNLKVPVVVLPRVLTAIASGHIFV